VGLLAVAGLILLGPASASAASIDLPTGTSAAVVDPLEVSSYRDEFEVSKQTAEENLETQEDGAGIVEALEASQGKSYAGVWFDNESGEFVVPTAPGASRASVAASLDASDLGGDFRTKPVSSSWDELEAAQKDVNSALQPLIEEGLVGTSLDPRTNAVVISRAAGANGAQRAEIQAAAQGESVEVEVRESQESKLGISTEACIFAAAHCDAPMRGGVNIVPKGGLGGGGCTAGFKGIGDAYGNRFVITAGHCVTESGATNWDSFTASPEGRQPLGHADAYSFPTHDYAAINANGTYWDKPSWPVEVTYWGLNQEYPIGYESSSYIGESVCHAGQQSGLSCGNVAAMHLTEPVEDTPGHILGYVNNLTKVEHICTHGGDSGGPVFSGGIAVGIYSSSDKTKGTLNDCYWNGYYTEITEDTDLLGIHVAPRIPPPPPPPTWHPADNLGGTFTSDLDIASWGPGRLDVFGRGAENALWHKWWSNATGWSVWEYMGGNLASAPSAVSWGPNRLDVVARATDNTILHWWWDPSGWHSDNLGGNIVSNPDISSWGAGRLDIFGRGPENALWHRAYSNGYFPWESLGGTIAGGPGAVSWAPGRIDIAARTPSNEIAHWFWLEGWHSDSIPGLIYSDPDLSSRGPGRLDLFAQGADGNLYHRWWENATGWSSIWEGLGGPITSGPGAVSWEPNNRIDVVARAADNSALHWYWGP
jgi:hypothetical protein